MRRCSTKEIDWKGGGRRDRKPNPTSPNVNDNNYSFVINIFCNLIYNFETVPDEDAKQMQVGILII